LYLENALSFCNCIELEYLPTSISDFIVTNLILKKGCIRLAAASDKAYQLLAHGRWFSTGTPASSTTKTGRRDIAEILLKVALNTINQSNKAGREPTPYW
jgi:hypothetical protein